MALESETEAVVEPKAPERERASDGSGRFAGKNSGHVAAFEAAHERYVKTLEEGASHGEGMVPVPPKKVVQPKVEASQDDSAEGEPDEKPGKADSSAVEAGLSALKRLKVPAKLIEAMSKAEVAEYGKEAARQAAEKDSLFRENGELRKQVGKSKPKETESSTDEQPDDLEAELKLLASTLDDDAGKAVGGLARKIAAQSRSEVSKLRAQLEEIHGSLQLDEVAGELVDEAKADLAERFPQLSDRKFIRKTVLPMMGKLNSDGEYTDANGVVDRATLLAHAAKIVCEEKPVAAPQSRSKAANPITDTSSSSRSRPKTLDQKMDMAFDMVVKKGLPLDQVRSALR